MPPLDFGPEGIEPVPADICSCLANLHVDEQEIPKSLKDVKGEASASVQEAQPQKVALQKVSDRPHVKRQSRIDVVADLPLQTRAAIEALLGARHRHQQRIFGADIFYHLPSAVRIMLVGPEGDVLAIIVDQVPPRKCQGPAA